MWRDNLPDASVVGPLPNTYWITDTLGEYDDPANWTAGVPEADDVVGIHPNVGSANSGTIEDRETRVMLPGDVTSRAFVMTDPLRRQRVTVKLGGATYTLTGDPAADGLANLALLLRSPDVGGQKLDIENGTLRLQGDALIDEMTMSIREDAVVEAATVTVGGGASSLSIQGGYSAAATHIEPEGFVSIALDTPHVSLGALTGEGDIRLVGDAQIGGADTDRTARYTGSFRPLPSIFGSEPILGSLTKVGDGLQAFDSEDPVPLAAIEAGTVAVADGGVLNGKLDLGAGLEPALNHTGGVLSPGGDGQIGTVTVEGVYVQQPGDAALRIEIDAATGEADLLVVEGDLADLRGTIEVAWLDGVPAVGQPTFQILDPRFDLGGALGGDVAFDFTAAPLANPVNFFWDTANFFTTGEIRITLVGVGVGQVPEPSTWALLPALGTTLVALRRTRLSLGPA